MSLCLKCNKNEMGFEFDVLEVHTLHIRDFDGEKRVQALGGSKRWTVCSNCAADRLAQAVSPRKRIIKNCLPYILVLVIGIVLLFFTRNAVPSLKLVAPAAIFCGIAGAIAAFQKEQKQSASLKALPKDKALREAAWICLLEQAPKKQNDNDITYIPKEALVSCQDANSLALQYDLLPAIAKQAISNENRIAQKLHSSIGKSPA